MIRHGILTLLIIFSNLLHIQAQFWLDTIEIKGSQPFYNLTLKADAKYADSLHHDITGFLQKIRGSQVQISTPGGLTTLLHRGMGNRHLPVLWHGFNLQNTINGSYDMALIPGFLFDDISFYNSGNPALAGNNGLAGTLTLNNSGTISPESKLFVKLSSLQNYDAGLVLAGNKDKLRYKFGVQAGYHHNLYKYAFNRQKFERQSTDFFQNNIVFKTQYLINNRQSIHADLWWQNADRIIPTSITSANIIQRQRDANMRAALTYKYYTPQSVWNIGAMYSREKLDFMTPVVDSRAKTDIFIIQAGWTELSNLKMNVNLQHRTDVANPNFFNTTKQRNTTSVGVFKHVDWTKSLSTEITIRQDLVDKHLKPFSWTLSNHYASLQWHIASNYNLPGFNDLYWPTGGNPDLKTEQAYKSEVKYAIEWQDWQIKPAIYANLVNNWIQWVPQANGLWSPVNQKKVLSRGFELSIDRILTLAKSDLHIEAGYVYNRTTALSHYFDKSLVGKQLIYIPTHKVSMHATYYIRKSSVTLFYQWTGNRYDTPDETGKLDPVHLLHCHYSIKSGRHLLRAGINNILNKQYHWVRFYPMPGIHGELSYMYHL